MDNMKGKNTRIALFGISRSGKDYTIGDFIEIAKKEGMDFVHMSPMNIIRSRLYGRRLSEMSETAKNILVCEVRHEIDKMSSECNVIVDEHFCFPSKYNGMTVKNGYTDEKIPYIPFRDMATGRVYEQVFPETEYGKYDLILSMDIDPEIIVDRCRTSEGAKHNPYITAEDARQWQRVETDGAFRKGISAPNPRITDPDRSGEQVFEAVIGYLKGKGIGC